MGDNSELKNIRSQINKIDSELITLLANRRKLSREAISAKDSAHAALRDPKREQELLCELIQKGRELGVDSHYVTSVFYQVLEDSVRVQQDYLQQKANNATQKPAARKVGFHGIDGSYSHLASKVFTSSDRGAKESEPSFVGYASFETLVKAVEHGDCDYALLPIESTSSGAINEVYDLLLNSKVSIIGEEKFRLVHCLVGNEKIAISHLTRIYCSPLTVAECSHFLATVPECRIEYTADSALALKRLKESGEKNCAAIASEEAAQMFGLTVLGSNIANQEESYARYLVISRSPHKVDQRVPAKTSLVISTAQRPGALAEVLAVFKDHAINLTKLESRPMPGNSWEEMFYLDFDGNLEDEKISEALAELTKLVRFIKVLGCYPSCDITRTKVIADAARPDSAEQPAVPPKKSRGPTQEFCKLRL